MEEAAAAAQCCRLRRNSQTENIKQQQRQTHTNTPRYIPNDFRSLDVVVVVCWCVAVGKLGTSGCCLFMFRSMSVSLASLTDTSFAGLATLPFLCFHYSSTNFTTSGSVVVVAVAKVDAVHAAASLSAAATELIAKDTILLRHASGQY